MRNERKKEEEKERVEKEEEEEEEEEEEIERSHIFFSILFSRFFSPSLHSFTPSASQDKRDLPTRTEKRTALGAGRVLVQR